MDAKGPTTIHHHGRTSPLNFLFDLLNQRGNFIHVLVPQAQNLLDLGEADPGQIRDALLEQIGIGNVDRHLIAANERERKT